MDKKFHWTPVMDGLFNDPNGKHHKAMGNSVWVFLHILSKCNWEGKTELKIEQISIATGIPISTTKRYIGILRGKGYIMTYNTGRKLKITVQKWRSIRKEQPRKNFQSLSRAKQDLSQRFDANQKSPFFARDGRY